MSASQCPECGHPRMELDVFCERCGAPNAPATGTHDEAGSERFGAVSDIGRRRTRNEDAFAVRADGQRVAAVVCDGVASTPWAGAASAQAALAGLRALRPALADAGLDAERAHAALDGSLVAARRAVAPLGDGRAELWPLVEGAPSTTYVATLLAPGFVAAAGVGDSRAYWVPADGPEVLLTRDHATAVVHLSDPAALADGRAPTGTEATAPTVLPLARQITRWVGADDRSAQAEHGEVKVGAAGTVVLCTDGLWQYVDRPGELGRLVAAARCDHPGDPTGQARALVDTALLAGGVDNVTVVVVEVPPC
jgi:serine/threonine protein phosphatase PrpC